MWKQAKNTLIYLLVRLAMGLVRSMSLSRSIRFGRWLGRRAFRWAGRERERTQAHLASAYPRRPPGERAELARSVFEHFGMATAECLNVHKMTDLSAYFEIEAGSRRVMDDVLSRGRGVVFVTCHSGNWELMARALALAGYPINTIGKKSYDPRLTRLIARFREQGAIHTIWRGEPDVMEKMSAVLGRGEFMGLLIDQDTRVPGAFVPFFNQPAYTPTAAAVLARKMKAPVVTGFNHRKPQGGYRIVMQEYQLCDLQDFQEAVTEDTAQLTARIEQYIRAHPAEWVWMHRRWKTRPNIPDGKGLQE